jgi:hypothetical protein
MRTALTAFISAASFCALASAASAQVAPYPYYGAPTPYPYAGSAPTIPSNTGAPLYSYHRTTAQPAAVGSCSVIAGNRVCSTIPAGTDNPAPYGYGYGGPIGAMVAAPFNAAGTIVAAPFGGSYYGNPVGAMVAAPINAAGAVATAPFQAVGAFGAPPAAAGATFAPATGTPAYSYESHVGAQRGAVGHCELIAGNRVCSAMP